VFDVFLYDILRKLIYEGNYKYYLRTQLIDVVYKIGKQKLKNCKIAWEARKNIIIVINGVIPKQVLFSINIEHFVETIKQARQKRQQKTQNKRINMESFLSSQKSVIILKAR